MTHPFTETYIAMAKAAEEIQSGNHEQKGNYFYCDLVERVWIYPHAPFENEDGHSDDKWIPRLDQLLGMLGSPKAFLDMRIESDQDQYNPLAVQVGDWHEMALAVVMREKYGKTWDGNGWVKA